MTKFCGNSGIKELFGWQHIVLNKLIFFIDNLHLFLHKFIKCTITLKFMKCIITDFFKELLFVILDSSRCHIYQIQIKFANSILHYYFF